MDIRSTGVAGTMESSDIMITLEPSGEENAVSLTSTVEAYYGDSIRKTILETLKELDVEHCLVTAVDHGALDCTIAARVTTAVRRAREADRSLA